MKRHVAFLSAVVLAVVTSAVVATPPIGGRGGARGGNAPATLEAAMIDMGRMLTAIKTDAADASKMEAVLRNIAQFQRDVAIAKMQPVPTQRVDAANQGKAAEEYRKGLTALQRTMLDLEDAVVAKNAEEIKKQLAKLDEIAKASHAFFKVGV